MNHNINKAGKLRGFSSAKKYWDKVNIGKNYWKKYWETVAIETINLEKLFDRSSDHK